MNLNDRQFWWLSYIANILIGMKMFTLYYNVINLVFKSIYEDVQYTRMFIIWGCMFNLLSLILQFSWVWFINLLGFTFGSYILGLWRLIFC